VITDLPRFKDTTLVFRKSETKLGNKIPKILHQIWIGPLPPPTELMNTWKEKHPDWEYRLWTDEKNHWENQAKIDAMPEWNGKADIMRYEILEKHGGVLVDADSECVQPLDDSFLEHEAFACWENETVRFGLIAAGYVGAVKGSALMRACIDTIKQEPLEGRAWECVGPKLLTWVSEKFPLRVFPAEMFIPVHLTGTPAPGDGTGPVYANQLWGSTFGYDKIQPTAKPRKPPMTTRKLEIGCGPLPTPGYEHNDLNPGPGVDHVGAIQDLNFPDSTFIEVYGTGCLEHLTFLQAVKFLKKALKWLAPGGMLNVNVPDMMGWVKDAIHESKDPKWIAAAFEGWCRWPGDEHKSFWTEQLLVMALYEVGFEKVDVYQRWAYAGPHDWHVCVKAYRPNR
jgi:predicted SAM-dependent methyltransferase